ncbi:MAG: flagellar biosynthetic protein FliP [Gemmatimonadetes bacterium]|nr:flagellar biosynthetic protein FliP [Gemmatimonadota bacterium]
MRVRILLLLVCTGIHLLAAPHAFGQTALPSIQLGVGTSDAPEDVATTIQVILALTILSLAPAILILTTCFTRLLIVFGFLRQALGTHQMPPNQVLIGLTLFLTLFIMRPVLTEIHDGALRPYLDGEITQGEGLAIAQEPIKQFMLRQTREKDLGLFVRIGGAERPANAEELNLSTIVPAFVVSELRIAFQIGFLLYIPFLVIDMVVASVLMSMGMMMLPPVMISLPFKILLFVLTDGWFLIVRSLVGSFS